MPTRDINRGHQSDRTGAYANTLPAGREGVENKDINGVVRWDFAPMQSLEFEAGYSRQNNLYAGDTQNTNNDNALVKKNYGKETNRIYRQNFAVTGTAAGITASPPATGRSTSTPATLVWVKGWQAVWKACSTAINSPIPIWPT